MVFPWALFLKESGRRKLSDIEYLSIKDFGGKRVDVYTETSVVNTATETDICTQTANTDKDMYLAKAQADGTASASTATDQCTIRLYVNGTKVEEHIIRISSI